MKMHTRILLICRIELRVSMGIAPKMDMPSAPLVTIQ